MFQDVTELQSMNIAKKAPVKKFNYTKEEVQALQVKPRTLKDLGNRTK